MRMPKGMVIEGTDRGASGGAQAASLQERVRARLEGLKDLPSSVATLQRALDTLEEPICTNRRLERVLASDQGAVAGLLRLANSAYFGVRGEVAGAATAIRVVGHRRLRALLCHLMAGKLFEILCIDVRAVEDTRRRALAAAVTCADVGIPAGDSEELSVAGLLHNIGELALASEFPEDFSAASDPAETFGVPYETAGATLLHAWRLPESIVQAACYWRTAPSVDAPQQLQRTIDAVHMGGTLAEAWAEGQTAVTAAARVREDVLERLGLPEERVIAIFEKIPRGVTQLDALL